MLNALGRKKPADVAPPAPEPVRNETLRHFPHLKGEHPTKWDWPAYLDAGATPWMRSLHTLYGMPITFPASLSPEAGLMLHGLIRNLQPTLIVEVGSFLSVSTHWMTAAMQENGVKPVPAGRVHCFDDFGPIKKGPYRDVEMLDGRMEFVSERLTEAGLMEYVRLHPGNSAPNVEACRGDFEAAGGVDFAFIDGDHSEPGVTADFLAVEPAGTSCSTTPSRPSAGTTARGSSSTASTRSPRADGRRSSSTSPP